MISQKNRPISKVGGKVIAATVVGVLSGMLVQSESAFASGGVVQPSSATTLGYTLTSLAQATAVYNTGAVTSNPATPASPGIPFQMLAVNSVSYNTTPSTYYYIPVFFDDNTPPVDSFFPASIANQAADAAALDGAALAGFNVSSFFVGVDGVRTTLDDSYVVGVNTAPLLDGTPLGNEYIVSAAVLSQLNIGTHTITEGGVIGGVPTTFASYSVSVPEPGAISLLCFAGLSALRRRSRRI